MYLTGPRAVATAALIATLAHSGQTDKAGLPYIDHPRRVVGLLNTPTTQEQVVAWLHDVVEDTPVTLDAIAAAFGPAVAAAVDAITHRRNEPRVDYYARVRANPTAVRVKLADIADNTNPDRLAALDPATAERLTRKYAKAVDTLTAP